MISIHLTQGLEIERGSSVFPHVLLSRSVGCCGKSSWCSDVVFLAGGKSSESAEVKTCIDDARASS